jgi:hypothetical protein
MKRQQRNILMIQEIASALGKLKDQVAFIGGATTALYIDDQAAPDPTPSDDVDLVVEISNLHQYAEFEKQLRKKGFTDPLPNEGESPPVCRKFYNGIQVDIMPTHEKILGFENPWFSDAMKNKEAITLPNETQIYRFNVIYFLATKLEAHRNRGKGGDIRMSQDIEDILAIMDGCSYIETQMDKANSTVKKYIKSEFRKLLKDVDLLEEAAAGFIRYERGSAARSKRMIERIRNLGLG